MKTLVVETFTLTKHANPSASKHGVILNYNNHEIYSIQIYTRETIKCTKIHDNKKFLLALLKIDKTINTDLTNQIYDIIKEDMNNKKEIKIIINGSVVISNTFKLQKYIRLGTFEIESILPYIGDNKSLFEYKDLQLKLNSNRLKTFKNNLTCYGCGLTGTFFALENFYKSEGKPHFNLYTSKDGVDILFTKDHIIPKSRGGSDDLSNLQTMCYICNHKKGNALPNE